MAKQLPKEGGRKWYTATIAPKEKREGHYDTLSHEVFALDEQAVKDFLTRKGWTWGRITITEGKNILQAPMNQDAGAERYHVELEAMLGHQFPPRYNSGPFPCGYLNTTQEVKDADARKSWATYLKEWSYGLSVSALPHYLEVDWYGTLYLPARWVQDPKEWHRCTAIVQATVKQCRASRAHMAEHRKGDRSPEGRELRKQDVEAVKSIPALEGWTFPVYVERLLHDYSPSPFDIPNPRLFDIVTGCMVPSFEPDRDYVKVEFWRHLLATWDGPANMRAEVVRSMLDHHLLHSERAEVLRALVKSTATRLRIMQVTRRPRPEHWMALADELEQWLADARKAPNSAKENGKPKRKRTDLKLLALVHALRRIATKDKDADISKDNAQALAEGAGSKGKQAGKDLFDRYMLYTLKANSKAERMQDGQPHTVKKRYLAAIAMLEDHSTAKAMAERELEELHAEKVDAGK